MSEITAERCEELAHLMEITDNPEIARALRNLAAGIREARAIVAFANDSQFDKGAVHVAEKLTHILAHGATP